LHVEGRRGTRDQAREYCRKEESRVDGGGPWEYGNFGLGGQGKRSDLVQYYSEIKENPNITDDDLLELYPATHIRYENAANRIRRTLQSRMERPPPRVHLFIGMLGVPQSVGNGWEDGWVLGMII